MRAAARECARRLTFQWRRLRAELLDQAVQIRAAPPFDDFAIGDSEHVHRLDGDGSSCGGDAEDFTAVSACPMMPHEDLIRLTENILDGDNEVRKCSVELAYHLDWPAEKPWKCQAGRACQRPD